MTLAIETVEFDRLPPGRAGWFVRSVLTRWDRADVVEDAELLVDELVANAMRHAHGTGVNVTVRALDGTIRVDVSDRDPDFFIDFQRAPDAPPRFGLRIVDTLAPRWGVEPGPFGKVVWFELDPGSRLQEASCPGRLALEPSLRSRRAGSSVVRAGDS